MACVWQIIVVILLRTTNDLTTAASGRWRQHRGFSQGLPVQSAQKASGFMTIFGTNKQQVYRLCIILYIYLYSLFSNCILIVVYSSPVLVECSHCKYGIVWFILFLTPLPAQKSVCTSRCNQLCAFCQLSCCTTKRLLAVGVNTKVHVTSRFTWQTLRPAIKIARIATPKVTRGPILSVASLERLHDKSSMAQSIGQKLQECVWLPEPSKHIIY